MGSFRDITGQRFGRLVVESQEHRLIGKRERIYWICRCDCGQTKSVEASNLTTGHARSCGCFQKESRHFHNLKHGMARTKTHNIWKDMHRRCRNPNRREFKNYGGRGIKVCKRWSDFRFFFEDMGECPPNHSIDRIDNLRGYFPDNCRWATKITQANNMRSNRLLIYKGKQMTVAEIARQHDISYSLLWQRLFILGWPIDKALSMP